MEFKILGCKIFISPLFVAFLCVVLLVDKTGVMVLGLLSVLIHESGHLFFMFLTKKKLETVNFQLGGIIIKSKGFSGYKYDFLVAIGGCFFNFLAFIIGFFCYYRFENEISLLFSSANFALMVFNLAPICGLDGMDLIRLKLLLKYPLEKVEKICNAISFIFIAISFCFSAVAVIFFHLNPSILICLIYLLILTIIGIKKRID